MVPAGRSLPCVGRHAWLITGRWFCCARAASGHPAAPPRRLMKSRRRIAAPKLRGQHCIGSNGYFGRVQTGHQNHCRSAQPMSLMGHKHRTRSGPGAGLCPHNLQKLPSRTGGPCHGQTHARSLKSVSDSVPVPLRGSSITAVLTGFRAGSCAQTACARENSFSRSSSSQFWRITNYS